jgi:capsular polysaccharide export protein
MQMTLAEMKAALGQSDMELPDAPARWGDMRQHMFWGALYHWDYRNFRPHRALTVRQEFLLYCRRLFLLPLHRAERLSATFRIQHGGFPYHLVLMQLEHDSSFQMHSPFTMMSEFLALVVEGFAKGAPGHHHLVFKAHPLEDGRVPVAREIARLAARHGVVSRVHFVRGGKLARLLNHARSAVTVNSTAAQQVLWRGLPLKVFGAAVYAKPEFASHQSLPEFFAQPSRPDSRAYRSYRHYLLETSQIPGGFYSTRGRRELLRQVVDMMLQAEDPYDALTSGNAAPRQQLRLGKVLIRGTFIFPHGSVALQAKLEAKPHQGSPGSESHEVEGGVRSDPCCGAFGRLRLAALGPEQERDLRRIGPEWRR